MGQGLSIEIINNGKTLANAYYRWSASSKAAAELARIIVVGANIINKDDPELLQAIKLLELTGARLSDRELEYVKALNELKDRKFANYSGEKYGSIVEYLRSLGYDAHYADDKFIIKKGGFFLTVPYDEYENGVKKPKF